MPAGAGLLVKPRGPSGAAFTPFDEPGMIAWWNSENTNIDGGNNVINYLDISGNGVGAFAASAPQRPGTIFGDPEYGGHASNTWSNVADTLVVSDVISISQYTLVQVCKLTSLATYLMGCSAGDYVYNNTGFSMYTPPRVGGVGASAWDAAAGNGWDVSASPKTFLKRMDGTHVGDTIRMNGVLVAMNPLVTDDPGAGPFNSTFSMMSYSSPGFASDGSWATSLLYDHPVTDLVAGKLETFFRNYYAHY